MSFEVSKNDPGRETERDRDRETERQRDRETERQRDRETERQRERETERQRDRETERQLVIYSKLIFPRSLGPTKAKNAFLGQKRLF